MKKFWRNYLESNVFFWVFALSGLVLIVASFVLPPMGNIDNSVLAAVGELDGVIALGAVVKAIDKGSSASIKHNGTEIVINNEENGDES